MDWVPLATRLGLHIALGYLLALLVLGPAPVGRFFYRLVGWTAAGTAALAGVLALAGGWPAEPAERLRVLATFATVLPAPLYVSNKPPRRRAGLIAGAGCGLVALGAQAFGPRGLGAAQLVGDALGAAVAGGACFAMVFGHGYLTVPKLPIAHLHRIVRWLGVALGARALQSLVVLAVSLPALRAPEGPRFSAFDGLDFGARYLVGLGMPLAFVAMTVSSLRYRNTQSATGILYAATVLVWIGEAVALHLAQKWHLAL
ncbi:MAG TPA: hypothetical protein VGC54_00615 [Planctomycetota bacterium]